MKEFISEFLRYLDEIKKILASIHFDVIFEIFVSLVILAVLFKLVDIFELKITDGFKKSKNDQIIKFIPGLIKILKFIIFFIMLAAFLQNHGYSVSSLIAGFGITGLAVGFAANATLSNIFGTVSLLSDKSYHVGDYIRIGEFEGTVEDINLRSTKIRTLENTLLIVPNGTIANTEIINMSRVHKRRFFETFGITYNTPDKKIKKAIEIIENIFTAHEDVHPDFLVYLDKLADSSVNICANAYIRTRDLNKFRKIKEEIILEIVKKFRAEGIEFAFPSQSVYLENNENKGSSTRKN